MFSTVFITLILIAKPINDGDCDHLSETFQDREAFSFSTQTQIKKEFIQDRLVTRASTSLSSAETSWCCGEAGEKEKESARARWEGEREKRGSRTFSLFPSFPAHFLFFSIIAIFIGIPSGSLCGGESFHLKARRSNNSKTHPHPSPSISCPRTRGNGFEIC